MVGSTTVPGFVDRLLELDDPDRGRNIFEQLYQIPKIDIQRSPEKRFVWNWRINQRGSATIICGQAQAGTVAITGVPTQHVLMFVLDGAIDVYSPTRPFSILPNQTAGIANANMETMAGTRPGTRTLNIRIDPGALASHASALIGAPINAPPRFEAFLDLRSNAGADVLRLARLLEDACTRVDSPLGSPHVITHLREALYSALLLGQKSTLQHRLQRPPPTVHARAVRKAEEILTARAAEPVSIAEVAEATGVGLRSLERSFKAVRGHSLRDFLKAQRLELAHQRLRAAVPGMTVTQVLHASGFSHPGEFSHAYRKRFGEAPSETLRRAGGLK